MTVDPAATDLPQQLFNSAQLHANQARRAAARRQQHEPPTPMERQLAATSVTQCAEAAMEWARWAYLTSRMPLPHWTTPAGRHRLIETWRGIGTVARALGRPVVGLSDSHATFLNDLDAWHQFIEHTSDAAEEYLHRRLATLRLIDGRQSVTRILGAELATTVITHTSQLFDWAATTTGLTTPCVTTAPRDGDRASHRHTGPRTQGARRAKPALSA